MLEEWDYKNCDCIDEDIKKEFSNVEGYFYHDVIQLQLVKTMKQLIRTLKKEDN